MGDRHFSEDINIAQRTLHRINWSSSPHFGCSNSHCHYDHSRYTHMPIFWVSERNPCWRSWAFTLGTICNTCKAATNIVTIVSGAYLSPNTIIGTQTSLRNARAQDGFTLALYKSKRTITNMYIHIYKCKYKYHFWITPIPLIVKQFSMSGGEAAHFCQLTRVQFFWWKIHNS